MTDLNKNLANLLDTGNDNRIENTSNLIESKNTLKTINKKKILYATIFGVMLINMQISKTEGSSLSVNATHDCTEERVSKSYTHTMDCTDINHDMRGHFSSQNYWPDSMCRSYFNGNTALTSRTWYTTNRSHMQGHTAHTDSGVGYNDGMYQEHTSHTSSNTNGSETHWSSETATCTLITNENQRICNELSFNFNGHYKTNVINEADLKCRLNTAHGSHSSHGSHGSHASHGSHGSHGSHASHASHDNQPR